MKVHCFLLSVLAILTNPILSSFLNPKFFKYKINSLFSRVSKIHEKEFEVLPEIWSKLHDAKDIISALVSPYQENPNFNSMNENEIKKSLENSKFPEHQIEELINSSDKNNYYRERII